MPNIKDDRPYDPFPKTGLVKENERHIRRVVDDFAKHYPHIKRQDFLFRAVELAEAAEKTFKPELGIKFKTYLGGFARPGRLKELHRLHDQQERHQGAEIYRTEEDLAFEEAEEAGEPTAPVKFAGGGNGARLLLDLQWWEARVSGLASYIGSLPIPTAKLVHRLKLGTQLRQGDNAAEVHGRISRDLPHVIRQQPPTPILMGWIEAIVDHAIRCQREADDEAEKRAAGDHSSTIFRVVRNWIDVKFYKGRKPPRFLPEYMPMARLDDAYSHHDDWKGAMHDLIATPDTSNTAAREVEMALEAIKDVRPTLTNKNEIAMLDRLEAQLKGDAGGGLIQVAREIGVTKGAASKLVTRLTQKFGMKRAK